MNSTCSEDGSSWSQCWVSRSSLSLDWLLMKLQADGRNNRMVKFTLWATSPVAPPAPTAPLSPTLSASVWCAVTATPATPTLSTSTEQFKTSHHHNQGRSLLLLSCAVVLPHISLHSRSLGRDSQFNEFWELVGFLSKHLFFTLLHAVLRFRCSLSQFYPDLYSTHSSSSCTY